MPVVEGRGAHQDHLEAARLQEGEQGFPVDAGSLQGDNSNAALLEPVGQGLQAVGEGGELLDLRGAVGKGGAAEDAGFSPDQLRGIAARELMSRAHPAA